MRVHALFLAQKKIFKKKIIDLRSQKHTHMYISSLYIAHWFFEKVIKKILCRKQVFQQMRQPDIHTQKPVGGSLPHDAQTLIQRAKCENCNFQKKTQTQPTKKT